MRMWMVGPSITCGKHLLGEHYECHMFLGCLTKRKTVKGYLEHGLLFPQELKSRHDALVSEMVSRGMNHKTPINESDAVPFYYMKIIPVISGLKELIKRCPECKRRWLTNAKS